MAGQIESPTDADAAAAAAAATPAGSAIKTFAQ